MKNNTRRARARKAMATYPSYGPTKEMQEETIIDLLTDLRHQAWARGLDFLHEAGGCNHEHYLADTGALALAVKR